MLETAPRRGGRALPIPQGVKRSRLARKPNATRVRDSGMLWLCTTDGGTLRRDKKRKVAPNSRIGPLNRGETVERALAA